MSRSLLKQHLALVQQSLPATREQAKTQQEKQMQQKGRKRKQQEGQPLLQQQQQESKPKKSYLEEARRSTRKKKTLQRNIAMLKAVGPPSKDKVKKKPLFKRARQVV